MCICSTSFKQQERCLLLSATTTKVMVNWRVLSATLLIWLITIDSTIATFCPTGCTCFEHTVRCIRARLNSIPKFPRDTKLIDLRFNHFEQIPNNAFIDLPEVTTLFLNENAIALIQDGSFDGLTGLRYLYLSNNHLTRLPENLFLKLKRLEAVYLENNDIWQLNVNTFSDLPYLSRIFIFNNKLTKIPTDIFSNLPSLKRLRLDNNPIDCDCGVYALWSYYHEHPQRTQMAITLTCETPATLYHRQFYNLQKQNFHCRKPEIMQAPHDMLLIRGDNVELPCEMIGDPAPEIIWMQNTNEITSDYSKKMQILTTGNLMLKSIDKNDVGIYECIGRNAVGETKTQPIRLVIAEDYNDKNNNQNNDINNLWNEQRIDNTIIQQKQKQKEDEEIHKEQQQQQQLQEQQQQLDHQYQQQFQSNQANAQTIAATIPSGITPFVPPQFLHTPIDTITTLNSAETVVLDCTVSGYPKPIIQWYFNGRHIEQSTANLRIHTNGSLVIVQPIPLTVGMYRCEATNLLGSIGASARVEIKELPEILIAPQNQTIKIGKSFILECDADGNPLPTISWLLNGKDITTIHVIGTGHFKLDNENTELIVNESTETDAGVYTCIAENENGKSKATATITIERTSSTPQLIIEPFDLEAFTGTTIELPCKVNENEGLQISWRRDGRLIDPNIFLNNKYEISGTGSLFVKNVTVFDSGRYECSVRNSYGRATASALITIRNAVNLAPGDRYVRIAFNEAAKEIDLAINNTIDMLFINRNRSNVNTGNVTTSTTPNYGDLLRIFRFPTGEARQLARAAEIYERTLVNIRKHVTEGDNLTVTSDKYKFKDLLSREHLHLVAELSGCMEHREMPNCTDMCYHSKYRSIDGTCNNLRNPTWGASLIAFRRIAPPIYENGFSMPIGWMKNKMYAGGFPKPSSRLVSTSLISTKDITPDDAITHMVMQWGQFLDHDLDHAIPSVSSESWDGVDCKKTCEFEPPCYPIEVPANDPRIKNRRCIDLVRSSSICGSGMTSVFFDSIQDREQINQLTSFIDASQVYGYNYGFAQELRNLTEDDGLLRVGVHFPNQKAMLPFAAPQDGMDCRRNLDENQMNCFVAGDIRVNEQIGLLAMHTIWMREHNRIATKLKEINSHWDGDTLYQEARKIVGAQMQHITYQHWLPLIIGKKGMGKLGEYRGYDPHVNPTIANEFATAALRFGHTIINPILHRLDANFETIFQGHLPLHKAFFAPWRIAYEGGVDPLMRGMFAVAAKLKTPDQNLNSELTEKLFQTAHAVALDLAAINIQRGRDHGIPGYNSYREFCNLTVAKTFEELQHEISSIEIRNKLRELYGHPDNIDIWVGGILEDQVEGGKVGPLFQCLLIEQFRRLRDGDRLYYENPGFFLPEQLQQIKQSNLGRVLCDNGDKIEKITDNVFILPKHQNGFKKCEDIDGINLYYWQDCGSCNSLPKLFSDYVPQTYVKEKNRQKRALSDAKLDEETDFVSSEQNGLDENEMNEERISGLEEVIGSFQKELKKLHKKLRKLEETCSAVGSQPTTGKSTVIAAQLTKLKRNHCVDQNGITRLNNEIWSPDVCTKCECRHGQSNCMRQICGEVVCERSVDPITPPESCCPHCPLKLTKTIKNN